MTVDVRPFDSGGLNIQFSKLFTPKLESVTLKYMSKTNEILWLKQLRELERYCNLKGFRVIYKPVNIECVWFDKKLIVMNNKSNEEIAMYHLLHEMGHVRVRNRKKYQDTYEYVYENFSNTSLSFRIATLQEELDAWQEGLKLANTLQLYIDRRKWEVTKTKCISTYLSWAERRKTNNRKTDHG